MTTDEIRELWELSPVAQFNKKVADIKQQVSIKDGDKIYLAGKVKFSKRALKKYLKENYKGASVTEDIGDATLVVFGIYANSVHYRSSSSVGHCYTSSDMSHKLGFVVTTTTDNIKTKGTYTGWSAIEESWTAYKNACRLADRECTVDNYYKECDITSYVASYTDLPAWDTIKDKRDICFNEYQLGVTLWRESLKQRETKLEENDLKFILETIRSSGDENIANMYLTNLDVSEYVAELMLVIGNRFRNANKSHLNAFDRSLPYVTYMKHVPSNISAHAGIIIEQLVMARTIAKDYGLNTNMDTLIDVYMSHVKEHHNVPASKLTISKTKGEYHRMLFVQPFVSHHREYIGFLAMLPEDLFEQYINELPFKSELDRLTSEPITISKRQQADTIVLQEPRDVRIYTALSHEYNIVSSDPTPLANMTHEFNNNEENNNNNVADILLAISSGYQVNGSSVYWYKSSGRGKYPTREQEEFERVLPIYVTNFAIKNIDALREYYGNNPNNPNDHASGGNVIDSLMHYSCVYENIENKQIQEYLNTRIRERVKMSVEQLVNLNLLPATPF